MDEMKQLKKAAYTILHYMAVNKQGWMRIECTMDTGDKVTMEVSLTCIQKREVDHADD